jgi:hypothetical protein
MLWRNNQQRPAQNCLACLQMVLLFLPGVSQLAARAADAVLNPRYFRKSLLDAPELSSSLPASGLT